MPPQVARRNKCAFVTQLSAFRGSARKTRDVEPPLSADLFSNWKHILISEHFETRVVSPSIFYVDVRKLHLIRAFCLLLPFTNSDWRSSTCTGRRCCFSRLPWPGALAASSGFTSTSSRMILRNTPDLVEPQIIMTSSQNTCRINSLGVAVANDVNAAEICDRFQPIFYCSGTDSVESTSFCWRSLLLNIISTSLSVHLRYFTSLFISYLFYSLFALNLKSNTCCLFMQISRLIIWCLRPVSQTLKRKSQISKFLRRLSFHISRILMRGAT